jgi:hypothetical protein
MMGACGGGGASKDAGPADAPADVPAVVDMGPPRPTSVVEQTVGPEGGTIALVGGASLEIPAGALAAPTLIKVTAPTDQSDSSSIIQYKLEPSGLRFSAPAVLRVPLAAPVADAKGYVKALQWSDENPLVGEGEQHRFQPMEEVAGESRPDRLALAVNHFSFVFLLVRVSSYQYLVKDIPARFLLPGDLLFALTSSSPGPDWQPGHVGVFVGGRAPCSKNVSDALIEATAPDVRLDGLDPHEGSPPMNGMPRVLPRQGFRAEFGHFYLGARRSLLDGSELSAADRAGIVQFLTAQVGKDYNTLGQGNVTEGSFSCVGLAESALDSVGKGVLPALTEVTASVPLEQFLVTSPVDSIDVYLGETVEIPVYGTVVHPQSPNWGVTTRGSYCPSQPCCDGAACNSYTIEAAGVPSGGAFTPDDMIQGRYLFKWTPQPGDAGRKVFLTFTMTSAPTLRSSADTATPRVPLATQTTVESLLINVHPCDSPTDGGTGVMLPDGGSQTDPDAGSGPTFQVSPIAAEFRQDIFSTFYDVLITNPTGEALVTEWSRPTCGTAMPLGPSAPSTAAGQNPMMTWSHPHPPCDPTTGHATEMILLTVTGPSGSIVCRYQGAETGAGPPCAPGP